MIDRAYNDEDVRRDPTLYGLAVGFLMNYHGTFEPLVGARDVLTSGERLPTQMVRMVLNCMRHDASLVGQMPAPPSRVIERSRSRRPARRYIPDDDPPCRYCGEVCEPFAYWRKMRVKPKREFFATRHPMGAIHRIQWVEAEWVRSFACGKTPLIFNKLKASSQCGRSYSSGIYLGTLEELSDRKRCVRCFPGEEQWSDE